LEKGFIIGGDDSPNCRGFRPEEFEKSITPNIGKNGTLQDSSKVNIKGYLNKY
jgi:hypothetical protein